MPVASQNASGVKKMPMPGKEKKIKLQESILKVYSYDPSSYELQDVKVEHFGSEEEAKKAALAHYWQIAFDNGDTDLSKDEFVSQTNFDELEPYDTTSYIIVPDKGNLKEGKIPAENRNTYYYVSLAKDMKKDGKSKEEIKQFFKDEKVNDELVDNILANTFMNMTEESKVRSLIAKLIKEELEETIFDRDILSRPLSNPYSEDKPTSPEELAKAADFRSEMQLRVK